MLSRRREAGRRALRTRTIAHSREKCRARLLPRVFDALRARELSQLIVRWTGHLAIGLHRLPGLCQRLRIGHGDPILEDPRRDEPDSLAYGHLIAVRREPFDVGVVTQRHGFDDERVAFPVAGG